MHYPVDVRIRKTLLQPQYLVSSLGIIALLVIAIVFWQLAFLVAAAYALVWAGAVGYAVASFERREREKRLAELHSQLALLTQQAQARWLQPSPGIIAWVRQQLNEDERQAQMRQRLAVEVRLRNLVERQGQFARILVLADQISVAHKQSAGRLAVWPAEICDQVDNLVDCAWDYSTDRVRMLREIVHSSEDVESVQAEIEQIRRRQQEVAGRAWADMEFLRETKERWLEAMQRMHSNLTGTEALLDAIETALRTLITDGGNIATSNARGELVQLQKRIKARRDAAEEIVVGINQRRYG